MVNLWWSGLSVFTIGRVWGKICIKIPTLVINTVQLDAVRRRADDILLQNLIADDDQHSGSVDIDHIDFSVPDVDDLDQDLELPNVVFDGPQDDH